jgi:hypothetical protein
VRRLLSILGKKWHGIDWLRASMSIAVVLFHLRVFGSSAIFDTHGYLSHRVELSDIINYNILHLSVPVFFVVSLFLLNDKWMRGGFHLFARLEKLICLYCFWVGVLMLFYRMEDKLSLIKTDSMSNWIIFIVTGGNSVFYFLFSLILLTVISYMLFEFSTGIHWVLLLFSTVPMWVFPVAVKAFNASPVLIAFWNPLNFLPYVFIASLTCKYMREKKDLIHTILYRRIITIVFGVCVVSAAVEWCWFSDINNFVYNGSAFPSLTRMSLVAGAGFLFLVSFYVQRPSWAVIRFLSDYSLGIYCLHGFVYWYYVKLKMVKGLSFYNGMDLIIVISVSLALSVILRRAFNNGLI